MDDQAKLTFEFFDHIEPVVQTLNGYRSKLITNGYSEEAAEQMCVHMHWVFTRSMGKSYGEDVT